MEKTFWHLVIHYGRVSGRCSDGRTFSEPTKNPTAFAHAMLVAFHLCGVECDLTAD